MDRRTYVYIYSNSTEFKIGHNFSLLLWSVLLYIRMIKKQRNTVEMVKPSSLLIQYIYICIVTKLNRNLKVKTKMKANCKKR